MEIDNSRQAQVERVKKRIEEELRTLSLEDLEDILSALIIRRAIKTSHIKDLS